MAEAIENDGVFVDPATHNDLKAIIADNEVNISNTSRNFIPVHLLEATRRGC